MLFLLTVLNVAYVLDPNLQPVENLAPNANSDEIATVVELKRKCEEVNFTCRVNILNTLSDRLYDLYMSMESPVEIWKALEEKYNTEQQGTNKFLMMKYYEFKKLDSILIMDQVHELQVLVSRLCDLKVVIPKLFQVKAIISKLPSSWNNYWKKFLHMAEDFTVEKILMHLHIEEETQKRDAVYLPQSSKVNYVSESKNSRNGKRKATSETKDVQDNKKKSRNCYNCNKKGHFIKDCRLLKKKTRCHNFQSQYGRGHRLSGHGYGRNQEFGDWYDYSTQHSHDW
ncbi:hypothetical protein PVK06_017715 [Gossypium arboreum]|uniref:CCHC-type domain-containing protein n=1 Tax=Gossypium arboreum TaxID=29729 RepID=A0ABR0Q488_GOSAR|nr:hypothetical protein PVK06_017715 [Gossypium arboreum]